MAAGRDAALNNLLYFSSKHFPREMKRRRLFSAGASSSYKKFIVRARGVKDSSSPNFIYIIRSRTSNLSVRFLYYMRTRLETHAVDTKRI